MKRSEMLKEIQMLLMSDSDELASQNLALAILDRIEELRMNPPAYAPEDIGYVWGDGSYDEPNGYKIKVYKWEPENET